MQTDQITSQAYPCLQNKIFRPYPHTIYLYHPSHSSSKLKKTFPSFISWQGTLKQLLNIYGQQGSRHHRPTYYVSSVQDYLTLINILILLSILKLLSRQPWILLQKINTGGIRRIISASCQLSLQTFLNLYPDGLHVFVLGWKKGSIKPILLPVVCCPNHLLWTMCFFPYNNSLGISSTPPVLKTWTNLLS